MESLRPEARARTHLCKLSFVEIESEKGRKQHDTFADWCEQVYPFDIGVAVVSYNRFRGPQ